MSRGRNGLSAGCAAAGTGIGFHTVSCTGGRSGHGTAVPAVAQGSDLRLRRQDGTAHGTLAAFRLSGSFAGGRHRRNGNRGMSRGRNGLSAGCAAAGTGIGFHTVSCTGRGCRHDTAIPVMSQGPDGHLFVQDPAAAFASGPFCQAVFRAGSCLFRQILRIMPQGRDINLIKNISAARTLVAGVSRIRAGCVLAFVLIIMPQFRDGLCRILLAIITMPVLGSFAVTCG